jgi:hypothetical protein
VIPSAAGGASQTRNGLPNTVDAIKQKMMVNRYFIMPPYGITVIDKPPEPRVIMCAPPTVIDIAFAASVVMLTAKLVDSFPLVS